MVSRRSRLTIKFRDVYGAVFQIFIAVTSTVNFEVTSGLMKTPT
jgi:hypothetical protein